MESLEAQPIIKILTIDGGGIRGLIPAMFVRELERRCNGRPVHELFDVMFEGQSDEADQQARAVLSTPGPLQHYLRLQPSISQPYKLDDISPEVRQILLVNAEREIERRDADIDKICRQLLDAE